MRKLFLYIFAGLIFCSIGNTNDIYEFEIEGISIGDSLLEHLSEKEIIKEIEVNSPFYNYLNRDFGEVYLFKDFEIIKSNFRSVNIKYYGFLTLVFFPFYSSSDSIIFKLLVNLDQLLFKVKIFRYLAWSVLITAKKN